MGRANKPTTSDNDAKVAAQQLLASATTVGDDLADVRTVTNGPRVAFDVDQAVYDQWNTSYGAGAAPGGGPAGPGGGAGTGPLTITNVSNLTGSRAAGGQVALTGTGMAGIVDADLFAADSGLSVQVAAGIAFADATGVVVNVGAIPGGYDPVTSQWYLRISTSPGDWSGVHGTDWTDTTAAIYANPSSADPPPK